MPSALSPGLVIAAILGGVAGALYTVWLMSEGGAALERDILLGNLNTLERRIGEAESSLHSLQKAQNQPISANRFNPASRASDKLSSDAELSDIVSRLEVLEQSLERLASDSTGSSRRQGIADSRLSAVNALSRPEHRSNTRGEEIYAEDSGVPLNFTEENISDVFHATNSSSTIQDISCRSSVCKITFDREQQRYSGTEEQDSPTGDDLLIELSEKHGLDSLDAYYAVDDQGHQVMYIHSPGSR